MQSYWPKVSTTEKYGIATVRTLDENKDNELTERTFEVSHKSKKVRRDGSRSFSTGVFAAAECKYCQC